MASHDAIPRTTTEQIPRERWESFLNDFSEFNQEISSRLELTGSHELGFQVLAEDRPLLAVTLDDEEGTPVIAIETGDTMGGSPAAFRHLAYEPVSVSARKTEPVGWDAIEIRTKAETLVLTINPHPGRGDLGLEEVGRSETRV
jgi:hypothetical protein